MVLLLQAGLDVVVPEYVILLGVVTQELLQLIVRSDLTSILRVLKVVV